MRLPEEFKSRMRKLLKDEYDAFIESYENRRAQGLRVNTLKVTVDEFLKICPFGIEGMVPWEGRGFYINEERPGRHPYHAAGLYYMQEPSAMAVVPMLDIQKGDRVLDLCAAPGGKSTQAASYLCGEGLIVSNEIEPKRAKILSENIERMGIRNAVVTSNSPGELEKVFPDYFDRIIVDAPCSGEGMFKKEESAIEDWSIENVAGCALRQEEILESAQKMLRPGGYLVYSTCTFSLEENEMAIDRFLKSHKNFEIVNIKKEYGFTAGFGQAIQNSELEKAIRLFPHRLKGEGHFICLLHKTDGNAVRHKALTSNVKKGDIKDYFNFAGDNLNLEIDTNLYLAGENLYSLPEDLCEVKGLRILRAGLQLGALKKNRFEPNHALALALSPKDVKLSVKLSSKAEETGMYLKGHTLNTQEGDGWCIVSVDGYSLGWGKISKGIVKNHYPKGLRW